MSTAQEESNVIVGKAISFIKKMEKQENNCFSINAIDEMLNIVLEAVKNSEVKFTRDYELYWYIA